MSTSEVTVVTYKDAFIAKFDDCVETVDIATGKKRISKSIRAAKWNISVWRRLCSEFTKDTAQEISLAT